MDLDKILKTCDFVPTTEQNNAIISVEGANLIIAGPGSGKSQVLLIRTLYLLLNRGVNPSDIILCTFTEKAAAQLKEKLAFFLDKLDVNININDIKCGTVHGICRSIIDDNIQLSNFKTSFDILDEITQHLFVNDNFHALIEPLEFGEKYLYKWPLDRKHYTVTEAVAYLNKISEENIDIYKLKDAHDLFHRSLGMLYEAYFKKLIEYNRIDFAHLQKEALAILKNSLQKWDTSRIFLMVDEYQDTNHIQELIFFELVKYSHNICVVGDDDQGIYRFRGATVKNILEFEQKFKDSFGLKKAVKKFVLNKNFRSHGDIIKLYNEFIKSCVWSNKDGEYLRHFKVIEPGGEDQTRQYSSCINICSSNEQIEASTIVEFVQFLMSKNVISDYSDVAILLKSVQDKYSERFIKAFAEKGIKTFCPRAKNFFNREEIILLIYCLHVLFDDYKIEILNPIVQDYINNSLNRCNQMLASHENDKNRLFAIKAKLNTQSRSVARDVLELFYDLISLEVFQNLLSDNNVAYNIGVMTQLLQTFQSYYKYIPFTVEKRERFYGDFFAGFMGFLLADGLNEYEDKETILPKDHIQILTIHQAKGLEFPLVIVGTLANKFAGMHYIDKELLVYYDRNINEPIEKYNLFDNMRLFYVAFSRAKNFLILLVTTGINKHFGNILSNTIALDKVDRVNLSKLRFKVSGRKPLKKKLSLTGDIFLYDTCPRQYQIFREFGFVPSSTAQFTVGILVHRTIEETHKTILSTNNHEISLEFVLATLNENIRILKLSNTKIIGRNLIENAKAQIINYYNNFNENFPKLIDCEQLVILEKERYYLVGRIDLLTGNDHEITLVDFKASAKPANLNDSLLTNYKKQLAIYSHEIYEKKGIEPNRTILFFTGETEKSRAICEVQITEKDIEQALHSFDNTANKILNKEFASATLPNFDQVCSQCDYRKVCYKDADYS